MADFHLRVGIAWGPPTVRLSSRQSLAEGLFRHLRTFQGRSPGWMDEAHVIQIVGLFPKGIKTYRERYGQHTQQGRYLVPTS